MVLGDIGAGSLVVSQNGQIGGNITVSGNLIASGAISGASAQLQFLQVYSIYHSLFFF